MQIRDRNQTRGINKRMLSFNHHIASGIDENQRRVARVGLHEPDNNGNIVRDVLKQHRNCAVGLKKVEGTAVVVSKRRRFVVERGVRFGERE
ncbi:hypothetical protein HanIR_Chr17g0889251 [Helianthus annuus]|nr:hypothetical protein HanIR_Chr17g0889251 [Helianthus annuus]